MIAGNTPITPIALNELLVRANTEWRQTFDAIPDLIALLDSDHRIIRLNMAMARRLGKTPAQLVGCHCYEAVHGMSSPPEFCPHSRLLASGKEEYAEVPEERLGGIFEISTTPIKNESGRIIASVHVARDITERKTAEEEKTRLEAKFWQSQRLASLGTMAGGIAHELRNPLAICSSYAQFLMGEKCSDTTRVAFARKIRKSVERATGIVENMFRFSQPVVGPMSPVDLVQEIGVVVSLLVEQSRESSIKVVKEFSEESLVVNGMPTLLQQVFVNLVQNAINAMPGGGIIKITGSKADGQVIISVSDTGRGIPRENINRIFDPFFTTADVGKGMGMGLPVCYSIVNRHNGTIEVESSPGTLTVFTIKLPMR